MTCNNIISRKSLPINQVEFIALESTSKNANSKKPKIESRRVLNPAFYTINPREQPLFQHYLDDKITDFERNLKITAAVSAATAPFLGKLTVSSPQGFLISTAIRAAITFPILHYSNVADQYRDLVKFGTTGKIYGYSVFGRKHTEV